MSDHYSVAVLLPTRGRATSLELAIKSLVELAQQAEDIQIVMGFDNDDDIGYSFFEQEIKPWLECNNVSYTAIGFDRLGYQGLNLYYNELARHTDSDWLFVWNDDSIMHTNGWDTKITQCTGQFKLLKVHTHRDHPYSIFPIWPRSWYELFGHVSRHQMIDAELSQIAYMLDLIKIIDVDVTHDRVDLTGSNKDATHNEKIVFEGNPIDARDFHNTAVTLQRHADCETISAYLREQGHDTSFWSNVKAGQQDPWQQLRINDVNQQMVQFHLPIKQKS